jgi:tetratricopeptide (TPR) repeat protein
MSDIFDDDEPRSEGSSSTDAAALSLALNAAAHDKDVAARAAIFLDEQTRLVRLQAADLEKEDVLRHWSLRVRHVNDLLKLTFGVGAAFVALMFAVGLAALAWNAHEATGLIIQPIKAPPDFAQRGLDGTVLAQRLLDKLNALVADADKWSFRAADSISGNWGDNSKVEIPETGISVFELRRFLRQSLGHETNMSGEMYRTPLGIALTVRVGANAGTTFEGREQDIDVLLSRAAQSLLEQTQPYRYVLALYAEGTPAAKVIPVAQRLADASSGKERTWSLSALEEQLGFAGRFRESASVCAETIASAPNNVAGYFDVAPAQWALGHLQAAIDSMREAQRLFAAGVPPDFQKQVVPALVANTESFAGDLTGAYSDSVKADIAESKFAGFDLNISAPAALASDYALNHDTAAARAILAKYRLTNDGILLQPEYVLVAGPDLPNFRVRASVDDWRGAIGLLEQADQMALRRNDVNDVRHSLIWPWLAYAWARTGRLRDAEALIAKTPLDCTLCLEMRGRIADVEGNAVRAEYWFDRAVNDAPSIPFADTDWGKMLLRRQEPEGAIAKLQIANKKSPHFADPLELWGEALMLQDRSDRALAKFEEANKYAPNWGRLHLKWGEALYWSSDKTDALKQFAIASGLDLSVADRAELVSAKARHG